MLVPRTTAAEHDWMRERRTEKFGTMPRDIRPFNDRLLEP
jgi:hypothetical protein